MNDVDAHHVEPEQSAPASEIALAALALALGADTVGKLTRAEKALLAILPDVNKTVVTDMRSKIHNGKDPLGEALCAVRTAETRRQRGAVYTPFPIVGAMLDWAETVGVPERVVEPGAGSARFLLESGRRFPDAELVAVETDPLAALLARANLAVNGFGNRTRIILRDFRSTNFEKIEGRTLYIGNPPYVRHHLIDPRWKRWLKREAESLDLKASTLAGLHVYFFLAIARRAQPRDYGTLITAAEWVDVNYGQLVRDLFLDRLGGQSVHVIEPAAKPFPGTQTTGAVTTFTVNGTPTSARFARIDKLEDLDHLSGGRRVRRERLAAETRWSHFTRKPQDIPQDYVELGELCRVHRGQVTGANRVWIAGEHSEGLPADVLFPTITRATELFQSDLVLANAAVLRRVIDLPVDLSEFTGKTLKAIEKFLRRATAMGAKDSYTAQHRKAWWSVGLREPAPVLATYMARRPPTFVLNRVQARHINIAHGLYPREAMKPKVLTALVKYLRAAATMHGGRAYAGGLTKFEPCEMERIPVPNLRALLEITA